MQYKKTAFSFRMFERPSLRQRRLFTSVLTSREVSYCCGMLTKVCRAHINYFKRSCVLHYLLTACGHIFTGYRPTVAKEGR